jgi:hypothetical protein
MVLMKQDYYSKKISSYDKYQALRRKPSYRKDYWEFFSWCREHGIDEAHYLEYAEAIEKAEPLCKKYGITYLFNPAVHISEDWGSEFFIDEKEIVDVIYPTEYRDLTEDERKKEIRPHFMPIPIFDNGNALIIKIDITADKESLVKKFIDYLKYYQSFLPKNTSRMAQDRMVDKWEVWDVYNETKSFKKAVEKLNARADNLVRLLTDLGVTTKAPQKIKVSTARKAYYRAFELVQGEEFDPDKHKPEKLPIPLRRTCDECPECATCDTPCPEVLNFVDQDQRYQRETPMPQDKLDILSSPRSHWTKPKPTME